MYLAVGQGVPRHHWGEIWKFLVEQCHLKHLFLSKQQPKHMPYKELLKQLTSQQHSILIDLGRTFPTHRHYSAQLGAGQLSLYNILKACSLLDKEVGYCQGLSFVAGILLLHMGEEEMFNMLKFLMFDMGLWKQYQPDIIILQIQMYQLSRLFHDYHTWRSMRSAPASTPCPGSSLCLPRSSPGLHCQSLWYTLSSGPRGHI